MKFKKNLLVLTVVGGIALQVGGAPVVAQAVGGVPTLSISVPPNPASGSTVVATVTFTNASSTTVTLSDENLGFSGQSVETPGVTGDPFPDVVHAGQAVATHWRIQVPDSGTVIVAAEASFSIDPQLPAVQRVDAQIDVFPSPGVSSSFSITPHPPVGNQATITTTYSFGDFAFPNLTLSTLVPRLTLPAGWTTVVMDPFPSLAQGVPFAASWPVTIPAGTPSGVYPVSASLTASSVEGPVSASAQGTVVIPKPGVAAQLQMAFPTAVLSPTFVAGVTMINTGSVPISPVPAIQVALPSGWKFGIPVPVPMPASLAPGASWTDYVSLVGPSGQSGQYAFTASSGSAQIGPISAATTVTVVSTAGSLTAQTQAGGTVTGGEPALPVTTTFTSTRQWPVPIASIRLETPFGTSATSLDPVPQVLPSGGSVVLHWLLPIPFGRPGTYTVAGLAVVSDPNSPGQLVTLRGDTTLVVKGMAIVPSAPLSVKSIATNVGELTVSWDPPAITGGSAITWYAVYTYPQQEAAIKITNATSLKAAGLVVGAPYTFTVTAWNGKYWGPWADWAPWTYVGGV
ncbi:MAG TPA: NEW3 domain-containing protein [Candidatus Dormibacteraeota bacterium]|nr:NEW3 domain-containing protein [Candidatus Dormibacteraeota bacterium]